MDGTQAVESVVCCEQGPGPLQDIWTGHWKYGADVVWLLLSQSQDMWIPQHCVHETGSRELAREWRWRSFPDLSYGAEARPDTLGFSDRGGVEEIVKIMAAVLNRNGVT